MDGKDHSGEISDENEELVIGQWRKGKKGNLFYKG